MNVSRASRFARGTRRTTRRRDSHVRSILWHARTFLKIIEPFQEPPEVPPCLRKETTCAKRMNLYPLFSFLIAKKIVFDRILSACETD